MYAADYKKELALHSEKPVPAAIAILLIDAFAVGIWYGYETLKSRFFLEERPTAAQ